MDDLKDTVLGKLLDMWPEEALLAIDRPTLKTFEASAKELAVLVSSLSYPKSWRVIKTLLASAYLMGKQ